MARGRPASRGWAERTWDPSAIGASHVGRSSLPTRLHRRHPGAFLSACRACASWCPRVGWDTLGAGGPPRTSETEERGGHERGIAEGKNRAEAERAGPGEGRRQSHQDPRAAVPGETASGALLKAICAGAPLAPTVKSPVSPGQWWPPGSRRNAGQPSHRLGQQNGTWDQAQATRARPWAWGGAPGEPGLVYLGGRKAPGPGRRGRRSGRGPGRVGRGLERTLGWMEDEACAHRRGLLSARPAPLIARVANSPVTARLSPCPGPVGRAPPRRVHGPVVATGLASSILLIQSRDGARTAQLRPRVWCWGSSGLWKPFGMLTRAQGALKVWGDRDSLGRVCFRTDS